MFSSAALLFPVTLTASFIIVRCLVLCQTQLVREEPHWFCSMILYGTRPFCGDTVHFARRAKWLWAQRHVCVHPSASILKLPSAVAWPGPALPDKWHEIFLSWSPCLIIQMRQKWVFMFWFLEVFFFLVIALSHRVCQNNRTRQFCKLTNAGDLKTAEILQNTQEKCGERGKHHYNHRTVWEDTFKT